MTRLHAVLFDLDGTLVATRRLYFEAFARALEPHVGHRMTEEGMAAYRPRSERRFLREVVGDEACDECLEAFYRAYAELHESHFEGVYPGVPEMLETLRARGVGIGLVTGKSRRAWEVTSRRAPLGPFDTLVFDDHVPRQKPDPAGLNLALERLGRAPEEAAYVGDSLTDVDAARAAGLLPAAVLWPKRRDEVAHFRRNALEKGAAVVTRPEWLSAELGLDPDRDRVSGPAEATGDPDREDDSGVG